MVIGIDCKVVVFGKFLGCLVMEFIDFDFLLWNCLEYLFGFVILLE